MVWTSRRVDSVTTTACFSASLASLIAVRCSMGINKAIKLTLFQFPKIILVFAALFHMIDSFREFKAPLLINHCLRGRCKGAEGTWWVHAGGGDELNKSSEVTVLQEDAAKGKDILKLRRVIQGQMVIFGGAVKQWKGKAAAVLLIERERESDCATGTMTSKDFPHYIFHTDLHISTAPLFRLPISLLLWLIRALWYSGTTARASLLLKKMCQEVLPSLDMPTDRHFLKRQCWQRFRFMRMIRQFSFFTHIL